MEWSISATNAIPTNIRDSGSVASVYNQAQVLAKIGTKSVSQSVTMIAFAYLVSHCTTILDFHALCCFM